jgi:phospholipid/cholesterol/gamma-HCH transport system substrate-binding protein
MSTFRAGLIAVVVIAVLSYFGFTKTNPFANPFELRAAFDDAANIKPNSPVRIAGVEVGKVKKVEPITSGSGGGLVTMEIKDKGLPIHKDAQVKIRPRIFLEGNKFVDIMPGSPSAPNVEDGDTIPMQQTAAPVQLGDLLTALQSDTRQDLKTFLKEYSKGLAGGGAKGFNESIPYWEPAYRYSALANDATLGVEPHKDIHRLLSGQQKTFAALARDEGALKNLVTNFNITAGAFASQDEALAASVPALRDTLRVGQPALASLNNALPPLRAFAREALPGVRSSSPTLDASIPFIRQLRLLMRPSELQGTSRQLRRSIPALTRLNVRSVPLLQQGRALSRCTNEVLVPFINTKVPDTGFDGLSDLTVNEQAQHGFVGLAGESRMSDGNLSYFHTQAVGPPTKVQPAPPPDSGRTPPRHRPDIPCETQETPDLSAPSAQAAPNGPLAPIEGGNLPSPITLARTEAGQARANLSAFRANVTELPKKLRDRAQALTGSGRSGKLLVPKAALPGSLPLPKLEVPKP